MAECMALPEEGGDYLRNNRLLRTNLLISSILLVGFILTALFGYKGNYKDSLNSIEHVSSLTVEGIYYQITGMFTKPVNISLTMAHDSLLVEHLSNEDARLQAREVYTGTDAAFLQDKAYIETTKDYLDAYQKKYGFDSVFLVSTASKRYYNFNGLDRVLTEGNPENNWYFDFLASEQEYSLVIDNDEVEGAENEITVFINCKIYDEYQNTLGVVGVGIKLEHLQALLMEYEEKFHVEPFLLDGDGSIEISTTYNGFDSVDWFEVYGTQSIRSQVLEWMEDDCNLELWQESELTSGGKSFVVARYIPELAWHLVVRYDTGEMIQKLRNQMMQTFCMIAAVIMIVLAIVTKVIRRFNEQIVELVEERQAVFRIATERMYDDIYEMNITNNTYEGEQTKKFFESIGAGGLPLDEGLRMIAKKQIRQEDQAGYLAMFLPQNVISAYEKGITQLQYDFMMTLDGEQYAWMRVDAHVFHSAVDDTIRAYTYRKNIDAQKRQAIQAEQDEMTGCFTKTATERVIRESLLKNPEQVYAFFIFDIDNFKTANDRFGHSFGDFCIREFAGIIRRSFRREDILGRIGGDEFVAFIAVPNEIWVQQKAQELVQALDTGFENAAGRWEMSVSIGIAIATAETADFDMIYRKADSALYQVKQRGKNGYEIFDLRRS